MRLLSLLNDLLDLSKLEAGLMNMEVSENDLFQTVQTCLIQFEVILQEKDLTLRVLNGSKAQKPALAPVEPYLPSICRKTRQPKIIPAAAL